MLKTDKDCDVFIEQANDEFPVGPNWDVSDHFRYFANSSTGFGITVQAVGSYFRTRVVNLEPDSTNYFRLTSILCPIVEALPRSLTDFGSLKTAIVENVATVSAGNCKTDLTALQAWEGSWQEIYNQSAIQIIAKFDQDFTVHIDQSQTLNPLSPDITDSWDVLADEGFAVAVASVAPYFRVRLTNTENNAATGALTVGMPAVFNPLPRKLDEHGHLETSVRHITDEYGFGVENTPMGEMRTIVPIRLVGAAFDGTVVDPNFWTVTNANGGTSTLSNGALIIATNTTANGSTKFNSLRRARYVAGSSMRYRTQLLLSAGVASNKRRWGIAYGATMPTITDGAYFELDGTTFSVVTLRNGVETRVSSDNFNGGIGPHFDPGTGNRSYEIYWTNGKVYFVIGDLILHTVTASAQTWAATMSQYIFMDNVNSGGITSNNTLECRVSSIYRLGNLVTQPTSKYQSGTTAGVICKYGAGNLISLIISNPTNGSVVTLYDGTSVAGTVIWASGNLSGADPTSTPLDFKGIPFFTGLFFTITAAACNLFIVYE
jgi:hypothetical protein